MLPQEGVLLGWAQGGSTGPAAAAAAGQLLLHSWACLRLRPVSEKWCGLGDQANNVEHNIMLMVWLVVARFLLLWGSTARQVLHGHAKVGGMSVTHLLCMRLMQLML